MTKQGTDDDQGTRDETGPSFDEQLQLLEQKVRELESGRLGLDAALERFEEGIQLTRTLKKRLDAAEGRVEELLRDGTTREMNVDQ